MPRKPLLTSEKKVEIVMSALSEKKAIDPVVLKVRGRTLMADFFVVASGTSRIHIQTLVEAVVEKLEESGIKGKRTEGIEAAVWVLLDYGDVVVHIMAPEQRDFYKLESFWTGSEKDSPPILQAEEM